jgi:hypothetical protein
MRNILYGGVWQKFYAAKNTGKNTGRQGEEHING